MSDILGDLIHIIKKQYPSKYSFICFLGDSTVLTNGYIIIKNDPNLKRYMKHEFENEDYTKKEGKIFPFELSKNKILLNTEREDDTLRNKIKEVLSWDEKYFENNGRKLIPPYDESMIKSNNKNRHAFFINKTNYVFAENETSLFLVDGTNYVVFVDKEYITYLKSTNTITQSSIFYTLRKISPSHFLYVLNSGQVNAMVPLLQDAGEIKIKKRSLYDMLKF